MPVESVIVPVVVGIIGELVLALVVTDVIRRTHLRALAGRRSRSLTPTATTSTAPTTSPTLRAGPLALATFIRHVKTFPFGNRSHEGAECRRAQAAYRVT
jgi:hypothetical protein